jgi:hypothetical protein
MKKIIVASIVLAIVAFVGLKMYRKALIKKVVEGYNVKADTVQDKSMKELKAMLKALADKDKK